jgi:hypothetical protein
VKFGNFILPAVALLIAVILLGKQRNDMSVIRSANAELRQRIATVRDAPRDPDAPSPATRPDQSAAGKKPVNWENLAVMIRQTGVDNRSGNAPGMLSIQRRLLAMDAAELVAGLDRIAAMSLDDGTRRKLEDMILDPLAKKDPELALNRFKGRLAGAPGIDSLLLSSALGLWAGRDPAAATAWLDREIAAGTFDAKSLDGYNRNREWFEANIIPRLFATDAAGAEARLSALPPQMRKEILMKENPFARDEVAYAELVRRQLNDDGRLATIGQRASAIVLQGGGFADVDHYLERISATPDERLRSLEKVSTQYINSLAAKGKLSGAEIDAVRAWARQQAPDAVDRLTGEGLGMAVAGAAGMSFEQASALALGYHQASANDDVLQTFLSTIPADRNKAAARELAGKISDPAKREKLLGKFQ